MHDVKLISIVGSTGSIGQNTLEVIRCFPCRFRVWALAARNNIDRLERQIDEFRPRFVAVWDRKKAALLKKRIGGRRVRIFAGPEGLNELCSLKEPDRVVFSVVGACGLEPLLHVIRAGRSVAVANKEPMAIAGDFIRRACERNGVQLLPIDSELSGIFQSIEKMPHHCIKQLVITASGGPFWKWPKRRFRRVTVSQALHHPRWKMGKKNTIDSATLMNKGLEVIEASSLFRLGVEQIRVLIHPEARVHSLVEFVDGSHMAQISDTNMKLPILYALGYPERIENRFSHFDLIKVGPLHFFEPDTRKFPALRLAYWAGKVKGTLPAVLNGANEIAVDRFLKGCLSFDQIPVLVERVMIRHRIVAKPRLADILEADTWARREAIRRC